MSSGQHTRTRREQQDADKARQWQEESRRSKSDITEDLTEAQLADVAMSTEVVVYWIYQGDRRHGIITGYQDPRGSMPGLFQIDVVGVPDIEDTQWVETGETIWLPRTSFVVFGPANRDPGAWKESAPQSPVQVATELLRSIRGFSPQMSRFLALLVELEDRVMDHMNSAKMFNLRLDINATGQDNSDRKFRLLVRAVDPPLLHDEMECVLGLASKYELQGVHGQAGIEIREVGDL